MTLRLAGEDVGAVQGLDGQGWVRETRAADASPGLKVDQLGTGRIFDFQDGGVSKWYLEDGGDAVLEPALDARGGIKNGGAAHGGEVAVLESVRVKGQYLVVRNPGDTGNEVALVNSDNVSGPALKLSRRTTHVGDADVDPDFLVAYLFVSGATRQAIFKTKDGGVVYTGTVNLT